MIEKISKLLFKNIDIVDVLYQFTARPFAAYLIRLVGRRTVLGQNVKKLTV